MRALIIGIVLFFCFVVANAQNFVIHKVQKGETLYGLSKKYNTTIDVIYKNNPSLTSENLKLGTELRIPQSNQTIIKTSVQNSSISENNSVDTKTSTTKIKIDTILHQVKPKETMYGISKLYNVSINDIQKWNNLSGIGIQIDLILKILKPIENNSTTVLTETKQTEDKENNKINIVPEKKVAEEKVIVVQQESKEPIEEHIEEAEIPIIPKTLPLPEQFANQSKSNLKITKATGAPMNTADESIDNTFFALHKTAKIGSVIKVRNLENNKIAYAKVIGKLPDTDENRKVLVRLSLGVRNAIKMGNGKAYLEMEFITE